MELWFIIDISQIVLELGGQTNENSCHLTVFNPTSSQSSWFAAYFLNHVHYTFIRKGLLVSFFMSKSHKPGKTLISNYAAMQIRLPTTTKISSCWG